MATARKMVVLLLKKTNSVVGAVTRQTPGAPKAAAEVVGKGLLVRPPDAHAAIVIPPDELDLKEVDYDDAVFYDPRAHVLDGGNVSAPSDGLQQMTYTAPNLSLQLTTSTVPDAKAVLVAIENGTKAPLLLNAKTTLNNHTIVVPVPASIDPGTHQVLAAVEGFASGTASVGF